MGCLFLLFNLIVILFFGLLIGLGARMLEGLFPPGISYGGMLLLIILVIMLGVGFISWIGHSLRRMSLPVGDLLEAAERVANGDYSVRVREMGPPEVRSLAHAFNTMASRLQATDEQKRNFLADVTHELRTPLAVIQGNVEGMLDGLYQPNEERLKSILEETQLLARLVDDMRTLALAESGTLDLRREPVDLVLLINETVSAFRGQAAASGVKLVEEVMTEAPRLQLDPERMRQVLSNLIANALRYTPPGGSIWVRYRVTTDGAERAAAVEIEDSGTGISPDEIPYIFDRFHKARDSGGMGLGLSIAKNLVEAHGGTIEAASESGKGTLIRLRIPGTD